MSHYGGLPYQQLLSWVVNEGVRLELLELLGDAAHQLHEQSLSSDSVELELSFALLHGKFGFAPNAVAVLDGLGGLDFGTAQREKGGFDQPAASRVYLARGAADEEGEGQWNDAREHYAPSGGGVGGHSKHDAMIAGKAGSKARVACRQPYGSTRNSAASRRWPPGPG